MKFLLVFVFLVFSINAFAENIKLGNGKLLWQKPHTKREFKNNKSSSLNNPIYYTPKCNFICYMGCTTKFEPIEGKEILLTPWMDLNNIFFEPLPAPFDTYSILIAQGYGGAVGGESDYTIQANIQSLGDIVGYEQPSVSLDKLQVGGRVILTVDLAPDPETYFRAECTYTRTK